MFPRLVKIIAFGWTIMAGTLLALQFGLRKGSQAGALTLALTTFVLIQCFNASMLTSGRAVPSIAAFSITPCFGGSYSQYANHRIELGACAGTVQSHPTQHPRVGNDVAGQRGANSFVSLGRGFEEVIAR
jgi:hypothetical protein